MEWTKAAMHVYINFTGPLMLPLSDGVPGPTILSRRMDIFTLSVPQHRAEQ